MHAAEGPSAAVVVVGTVASRLIMIDLLVDGRCGQLLSDHPTQQKERSIAVRWRKRLPEMGEQNARR